MGLVIGFVASGFLRDHGGSGVSALIFGLAILIAAGLTIGVHVPSHVASDLAEGSVGLMRQSFRAVAADSGLATILLMIGLTYFVTQALELIGISFAREVLGGNGLDQGLLAGIEGAGALIGSAVAVTLVLRSRLALPLCAGLALAGVPFKKGGADAAMASLL